MKTELLQTAYSRGAIQDLPRHALPSGSVWKMTDLVPDLGGARLQKRGGWMNETAALGAGSYLSAVAFAPFSAGDQLVAIDNAGTLYDATAEVSKGAAVVPVSRPVFFTNLLIIPGSTVKKYDGSTAPADLTGAPANGLYATTYKSRLVLGVGSDLHFSVAGDPQSWDALSTIGMTDPITGVAALRNMIAVFSKARSERVRGSIPPDSTTDGDMVREPMFDEGCIDARSIAVSGDKVIWANANGVHISDGAAIDNLIALGGLQQYWTNLMGSYTSSWTLSAGLYSGYYVIAIMNGGTFVDALACRLSTKTWIFLSNLPSVMFAEAYSSAPQLYFAQRGATKVGSLGAIFSPSSSNASDGNGTAVQPTIELPFYRGNPGSKRWRNFYLGVDLDASAGTYLQLEYTTFPEDLVYDDVADDAGVPIQIAPTSGYQRTKIPFKLAAEGVGLKITQVGASNKTMLFDVEAELHEREGR